MPSYVPPPKGVEYVFFAPVVSQADQKLWQVNPTIAAGDFQVSTDGGAFGNLATLPVVTPAAGTAIKFTLSASEMDGDNIYIQGIDAAGAEWCGFAALIPTTVQQIDDLASTTVPAVSVTGAVGSVTGNVTGSVGSLAAQAKLDVNAEVLDVLATDVIAEAAGVPGATGTISGMLARLYAALRSGVVVNKTTLKKQYANNAGAVQWEKDITDNGTEYSEGSGNAP